jgi:hypothetical protein
MCSLIKLARYIGFESAHAQSRERSILPHEVRHCTHARMHARTHARQVSLVTMRTWGEVNIRGGKNKVQAVLTAYSGYNILGIGVGRTRS